MRINHKKLNKRIKDRGHSKTWLAEQLNISRNYLSLLCHGKRQPSIETLMLLCMSLEVNTEDITYGKKVS